MSGKEPAGDSQTPRNAAHLGAVPDEPANQSLAVYHTRPEEEGDVWTPQYGVVRIPDGWELLPRGDAFVTRQVKKGPHWILKGRYNRKGGYTPVKGLYAPAEAIEAAQAAAEATEAKRKRTRQRSRLRREKEEERYRQEFEEASHRFLDFAAAHRDLAQEIARGASAWACETSSGRVGRTSLLGLEEKAALAVRAYIRHRYTDYESNLPNFFDYCADEEYRQVKAEAQWEVDGFLQEHRAKG